MAPYKVFPTRHLSTVREQEAIMLYAILKGYKINIGTIIENSIMRYHEGNKRGVIPHPATVTILCLKAGVKGDWGTEEEVPLAPPLLLTGVTKGPRNQKKVMRFGKKGKLSPRFIGSYEVIEKVGPVAYRLALPQELEKIHNVFHVSMLRKYRSDPLHVVSSVTIEFRPDLTYKEEPVEFLVASYFEISIVYTFSFLWPMKMILSF